MQNPHTEAINFRLVIAISLVATIGGFLFGFDSGVINGTVSGLQSAFNSDSVGTGFNVASMLLGCAVGAFAAGRLADLFGRKSLMLVAALLFIVSAFGSGIATTSVEFVLYRIIGGLAVGAASVMAPAYISEVAPAAYRGRLATIQQVAIIFGLFVSFLSNYTIANIAGSAESSWALGYEAWRWMFWIELAPAALFFVALLFIPESPRYLVSIQKTEAAHNVLAKLFGSQRADQKIDEIGASLKSNQSSALRDIFKSGSLNLKPVIWVGIGLAVFQQLVGINVVFYYGAVLWQSVGFSESDALLINVISGAVSIAACLVAITLIDKIGRKPLLWFGSLGMLLTLVLIVGAFASADSGAQGAIELSDSAALTALVSANLYVFFFNFSWGPVMWVMLGEMFSNRLRGSGLAIAGLFQWSANFVVTMTFPILLTSIGLATTYGLYAVSAAAAAVFVYLFVKETKGLTLEEMQS